MGVFLVHMQAFVTRAQALAPFIEREYQGIVNVGVYFNRKSPWSWLGRLVYFPNQTNGGSRRLGGLKKHTHVCLASKSFCCLHVFVSISLLQGSESVWPCSRPNSVLVFLLHGSGRSTCNSCEIGAESQHRLKQLL